MKTKLLALVGAAACALGFSSCAVYDDFGYGYGGVPVGGYYDGGYGYGGYGYGGYGGYAYPAYSSLSVNYLGGGYPGYGYGYGNRYYGSGRHYHSRYTPSRPGPGSYAARVSRPSTFRGSTLSSSPPSIPSLPAPRSLSRPTFSAPAPRSSGPAPSFTPRSAPMPSGRVDRAPPMTTVSRSMPSAPSSGSPAVMQRRVR